MRDHVASEYCSSIPSSGFAARLPDVARDAVMACSSSVEKGDTMPEGANNLSRALNLERGKKQSHGIETNPFCRSQALLVAPHQAPFPTGASMATYGALRSQSSKTSVAQNSLAIGVSPSDRRPCSRLAPWVSRVESLESPGPSEGLAPRHV